MAKITNSGYMGGWMGQWVGDWMGAQDSQVPDIDISKFAREIRSVKFIKWACVAGFTRSDITVKFVRVYVSFKVVINDAGFLIVESEKLSNVVHRTRAHKIISSASSQKVTHASGVSKATRVVERIGKISKTSRVQAVKQ